MALIYRAYYALIRNPRLTSTGRNTNAQFGFTSTLLDLINKEKPTHMAVAFDTMAPTDRHTTFAEYKANRQDAPEDLIDALPDIKRIIEGFNIPVIESDGYEADDVIGTLAWQAANAGYAVYMVTPDKDYGQLVKENVFIYKPPYQGNKEEIMGPREICEKWQIANVNQVIDILGLMGDAVDNIPGIAGIGEKTAMKLLSQYHSLENVLANADTIGGKMGEKIKAGAADAVLSKQLATIITDVPVTFHEEDFCIKEPNKEKLTEIFTELEFKTLGKRILGDNFSAVNTEAPLPAKTQQQDLFGNIVEDASVLTARDEAPDTGVNVLLADKNIDNTPHTYHLVDTAEKRAELIARLMKEKELCFDTETTGTDANAVEMVGMSFACCKAEGWYIPVPADQTETKAILETFRPLFENEQITFVGQNIKYDMIVLKWYGINIKGPVFDTMLAHYLIEPEGRRSMDLLSAQYLQYAPVSIETLIGKKGKNQGIWRRLPEGADQELQLGRH
jgi:DNA polymerase-1